MMATLLVARVQIRLPSSKRKRANRWLHLRWKYLKTTPQLVCKTSKVNNAEEVCHYIFHRLRESSVLLGTAVIRMTESRLAVNMPMNKGKEHRKCQLYSAGVNIESVIKSSWLNRGVTLERRWERRQESNVKVGDVVAKKAQSTPSHKT